MAASLSVLCVHGVGHGEADPHLQPDWSKAIEDDLVAWQPALQGNVTVEFLKYDALFAGAPNNAKTYAEAFARVLQSAVVHGIGDLFRRERGLFEFPEQVRWTAGMVAQWISDEDLRRATRQALLAQLQTRNYDLICAHSLGSLICYDTFIQMPAAVQGRYFLSLGSQIGNPAVRNVFGGRLEILGAARKWFHLFNPHDHVFTADIRLQGDTFVEIGTPFDVPDDPLNHNPLWYFNHNNTRAAVWREVSGTGTPRSFARSLGAYRQVSRPPDRRALLIGINDYPDPANHLDGCVNDVFLMSAVLQECNFKSSDLRVVLNGRATAQGIRDRMHWLLDGVTAGDERVLFYSGHGAQMPAYGPTDEVDHMDECLVPVDFDWTPEHAITDKWFLELYAQLPYESTFVAIFDCCHSGGMTREGGRKVRGLTPPDDIRHRLLQWNSVLQSWEERPLDSPNESLSASREGKDYLGDNGATNRIGRAISLRRLPRQKYNLVRKQLGHNGPYLPVLMEACQENQLSYEYRHGAESFGAFTYNLAATLRASRRGVNFTTLTDEVADRLTALRFDQTPNLVGPSGVLKKTIPWHAQRPGRRPPPPSGPQRKTPRSRRRAGERRKRRA